MLEFINSTDQTGIITITLILDLTSQFFTSSTGFLLHTVATHNIKKKKNTSNFMIKSMAMHSIQESDLPLNLLHFELQAKDNDDKCHEQ